MSNRQYGLLVVLVVVAGLVGGALAGGIFRAGPALAEKGTEIPRLIQAQEFQLVDAVGKVRVLLALSKGEPCLSMADKKGKVRALFSLGEDGGAQLTFTGQMGELPRAILSLGGREGLKGPGLYLMDRAGGTRAVLNLEDGEQPGLRLYDAALRARAVLGSSKLEVIRTGRSEERPISSLVLFDRDGKVVWSAPK